MRGCINVVVVLPRGINIISCFMLQKLTMSAVEGLTMAGVHPPISQPFPTEIFYWSLIVNNFMCVMLLLLVFFFFFAIIQPCTLYYF